MKTMKTAIRLFWAILTRKELSDLLKILANIHPHADTLALYNDLDNTSVHTATKQNQYFTEITWWKS